MQRLNQEIERLGGADAYPVVSLVLFFDGNDDPASIGPNLDPHPGIRTFERVLEDIRRRPEVSDVVVQIDEVIEGRVAVRFSRVRDHHGHTGGSPPVGNGAPAGRVHGR
jgi:hypothetical protein